MQPLEPRPPEPARARLPEPGLSREPPRPDEPPPPPPEPTEARRETPVIDPATGQVQQVAELPAAAPAETAAAETGPLASAHFETDSWRILPADTGRLRAAAAALREMTGRVVLEGHCDPRGTEAHNYALGLRRAEVVRDWLVRAGVSAERLLVQSRGESGLLSSRPEEYWKDRRVEFRTE
ncbi:OmpA family protein [candidate division WOR-3 bacterium]|nr:OmpA family protein [candidate division WOR-3 bacterium]